MPGDEENGIVRARQLCRVFGDILYLDPASLPALLARWGDICQTGPHLPDLEDGSALEDSADDAWTAQSVADDLAPALVDFLYDVVRRREDELRAATEEQPDDEEVRTVE